MTLVNELLLRDAETNGALRRMMSHWFHSTSLLAALCYSGSAALLTLLAGEFLHRRTTIPAIGIAAFLLLWFLLFMLMEKTSDMLGWWFVLPYQLFTLFGSLLCLRLYRKAEPETPDRFFLVLFWVTAAFSMLTILEDTILSFHTDSALARLLLDINPFNMRSFSESAMLIYYAVMALTAFFQLAAANFSAPLPAVNVPVPTSADPLLVVRYADQMRLSAREKEVLALMLENKSNQKICETLHVSLGTVKTHTHNLYQKTGSENRAELVDGFRRFAESVST